MKDWTDWEIRRHQVAIGGRVVDERDQPVAGAQVTITTMPRALRQKIDDAASAAGAGWQDLDERVDRKLTKADGSFYFLDLPGGRYTLQSSVQGSDLQAQRTVSVSWGQDGNVKKAIADLKLSKARRGRS